MTRVKHGVATRRRHKKYLKLAKGQFGGRSKLYRTARESVEKGMAYATRDRRRRKREYRVLWIARITAACKDRGISYSKLMGALKKEKVDINRKMLAELALRDKNAFNKIAELLKK
ncbi:MAG: 50S ribosomal protein L20 [Candidatus Omnitrophica bacterium]|nr:50S ribosomal protein L20 [Candidatus Omnitrophota bacterium]